MKSNLEINKIDNIGAAFLYFYVHFATEVVCFFMLSSLIGDSAFLWFCPLIYDALAFVPQAIIGRISDKYPKIKMGLIGVILMGIATLIFKLTSFKFLPVIIVALGNAFMHINGAEVTLRCSNGKLSHSAIFVAGGSFGVVTGKLFSMYSMPIWLILLLNFSMIPFVLLAENYRKNAYKLDNPCENFNYANQNISASIVIVLAVLVVMVRGYMGYGIPTSWNKTILQLIILYVSMGFGKAMRRNFSR